MLGKGEFFGEMALIDQSLRSVSVLTLCPSRLLPLTRESLLSHIQEDPAILLNLMQVIGRRIEKTNSLLRDLVAGDEELRSRLADREKLEPLGRGPSFRYADRAFRSGPGTQPAG